jgi:membrane associated rhomboid family serine protease
MPSSTSAQFSLPEFSGFTRRIVLWNLLAFLALIVIRIISGQIFGWLLSHLGLYPDRVLAGEIWQPLTYSFIHPMMNGAFIEAAFEIFSLWMVAGFLQAIHGSGWVARLYAVSVLGSAACALLTYEVALRLGSSSPYFGIFGAVGGLLGLITATGLLHGEVEFNVFLVLNVKAKYLAIIFIVIAVAETFGNLRYYALTQLGGALAALVYVRLARFRYTSRRGSSFSLSERWYGLRNGYYRWKRRRAASKFQVYMKKQGRTVKFDGQGRLIDDDDVKHDDRKRWN